jgi:hypothetical protein
MTTMHRTGAASDERRRLVRFVAAGLSAATAVVYLMIGLGVVSVVDQTAAGAPDLLPFGLAAGAAYALGAFLLVALDRRALWAIGSILQVGVIAMYIVVAPNRDPSFEAWGLAIKGMQLVLLGALLYLSLRAPVGSPTRSSTRGAAGHA